MNYEDQYILGIMARDAANGKESSIDNEYARNEAAAFAAMAMAKENRPVELTTEDIARGIYSRVSRVLSSPENVFEVCVGKLGEDLINNCDEDKIAQLCSIGYFYSTGRTNYQEVRCLIQGDIKTCQERGQSENVAILNNKLQSLEETMMGVAIPVIVAGLEDGSIDAQLASKTDEEIVATLIASDNTKESAIEEGILPTVKTVLVESAQLTSSGVAFEE